MSDISKCTGELPDGSCPWRETCYRYLAPDSPVWQSYMAAPFKDGECNKYLHYEGDRA